MNNPTTTFYIVRHGESESNANPFLGAELESSPLGSKLTNLGIEQAENTAKKLNHVAFDKAFSSDLIRAHKTAEIILKRKNLSIETTEILRERSRGKITGDIEKKLSVKTGNIFDEMETMLPEEQILLKNKYGIELREDTASRVITFLRETAGKYPGENILITCHGALMRSLLIYLGFGEPEELPSGSVTNGAYFVITNNGTEFKIGKTEGIYKKKI